MNEKVKSFLSGGIIGMLTKNSENKNKKTSGLAITSLIMGIFSVLLGWIPFFGWIFVTLAIVFGIIALTKINQGLFSGRGLAMAGFILGVIGLILAVVVMISSIISFMHSSSCTDMNCFIAQASQCQAAAYEETTKIGTISYSITAENSSCLFTKEIVKLSENEDPFLKSVLEGKKMQCAYSQGKFNAQWTNSLIEGLEDCQGELKEAIGQLLILV